MKRTDLATGVEYRVLVQALSGDGDPETRTVRTNGRALRAAFEGMPETHDGESAFSFRVAFSEDIGISFQSLREDAFTVTGGRVTGGKRVDDCRDLFEMTVEPDADGDVTITLPAGRECGVSGAICTKGENRRQLTNSLSATVAGPLDDTPEPNTAAAGAPTIGGTARVAEELTASTSGISDADGLDNASFAYQWIRTGADIGGATGSTYTAVAADEGKTLKVRVSFTDDAGNEESLTSAATDAVAARPDDTPEPNTPTTESESDPPTVSVSDARVREAPGATLDFAVTLSGASPDTVTVDYRTMDASAKAGTAPTHFTLGGRSVQGMDSLFGGRDALGATFNPTGADTGNPALMDESTWARMDRLKAGPAGGSRARSAS